LTPRASESLAQLSVELAEFPKAGRAAHKIFHKLQGDGIRGWIAARIAPPPVNLSV